MVLVGISVMGAAGAIQCGTVEKRGRLQEITATGEICRFRGFRVAKKKAELSLQE